MTRINLLKRKKGGAMTLDEFKTWLNKLIADKKGALPDLSDWKQIKENLDKVKTTVQDDYDGSGYSILPHIDEEDTLSYRYEYTGYDMNMYKDLESLLDQQSKVQSFDNINVTYNGVNVTVENKYETKKTESELNGDCRGK